jgi:SAM-dependent methyltransferase
VRPGRLTGERVSTAAGGFNPTWQRHVAAYALAAERLPPGKVLDLGCGVGHSFGLLAPRTTVGVDNDAAALRGQGRETVLADMRDLPFPDGSFAGLVCVQAIEHVPDPERVAAEAARVLGSDGVAIFITPNRLTFGPADEIIDPYHYVELDGRQLRQVLTPFFAEIELAGLFGSPRYEDLVAAERAQLDRWLRRDPLRLRRLAPNRLRRALYDWRLRAARLRPDSGAEAIGQGDFEVRADRFDESLDLIAVARAPRSLSARP